MHKLSAPSNAHLLSESLKPLSRLESPLRLETFDGPVRSLDTPLEGMVQLYRDRADAENMFDELKNQWGWSGYVTKDLNRCQIMARMIAQVYNWWHLFVRMADRHHHREAITSRPLLLFSIARKIRTSGQVLLRITHLHPKAERIQSFFEMAANIWKELKQCAEQLTSWERWRRLLRLIFAHCIPSLAPA